MTIFGPFLGHFRVLGHNSGHGPLRTKIFGSGESSHIVGLGRAIKILGLFQITPATQRATLNTKVISITNYLTIVSIIKVQCMEHRKPPNFWGCTFIKE